MVHGTLEVLLIGAKGLENTDYLCNMDPYALLKCRSQEQRSSIASGKGSSPEWNENFVFTVSDRATDLIIKLMDSDSGTADDFVGEATYAHLAIHACYSVITIVTSNSSVSVQRASALKFLSHFWHVYLCCFANCSDVIDKKT